MVKIVAILRDATYNYMGFIPRTGDFSLQFCQKELTLVSKALKEPSKEIQVGDWVRVKPEKTVHHSLWGCLLFCIDRMPNHIWVQVPKRYGFKMGTLCLWNSEASKCDI